MHVPIIVKGDTVVASFHVYIRLECYCAMYAMYISDVFDK